ncbi:MAG: uracil phosphoribosyltransferase [Zetaproteobacteria bacterium]|nr:uracil phosphoribosyltransferase [Pseudobdellovibrionaceae bacterium]
MSKVNLLHHPLVEHKLSHLRSKKTNSAQFRELLEEISMLMAYEVTRDFSLVVKDIITPIEETTAKFLAQKKVVLIPILRAGYGMLNGFLKFLPFSSVGQIGLYRDSVSRNIVEYYLKFPESISQSSAIVLDPLLATGRSADAALCRLKAAKPKSIKFVGVLASQEGLDYLSKSHPDVSIYIASVDKSLNSKKYIIPGLGDAGDRIFDTL